MIETQSSEPILFGITTSSKEGEGIARAGVYYVSSSHHCRSVGVAHRRTRKDGAVGIDGQTSADFEQDLESNLQSLIDRAKSGRYRAPAVRRVLIPKGDGRTRPIGIPTHEDKVLQRGVAMVLESIYEQDFLPCSYGFRPQRSAHGALGALREGLMHDAGWLGARSGHS